MSAVEFLRVNNESNILMKFHAGMRVISPCFVFNDDNDGKRTKGEKTSNSIAPPALYSVFCLNNDNDSKKTKGEWRTNSVSLQAAILKAGKHC